MPLYLSRFSYTPETWARLIANPEDRRTAAQSYIESVGGSLHGFWYAFGAHDGYTLWEAPDNVSMASVALALYVLYIGLAFGLRSVAQWRATGSTGFKGISGTAGSAEWTGGVLFVVA